MVGAAGPVVAAAGCLNPAPRIAHPHASAAVAAQNAACRGAGAAGSEMSGSGHTQSPLAFGFGAACPPGHGQLGAAGHGPLAGSAPAAPASQFAHLHSYSHIVPMDTSMHGAHSSGAAAPAIAGDGSAPHGPLPCSDGFASTNTFEAHPSFAKLSHLSGSGDWTEAVQAAKLRGMQGLTASAAPPLRPAAPPLSAQEMHFLTTQLLAAADTGSSEAMREAWGPLRPCAAHLTCDIVNTCLRCGASPVAMVWQITCDPFTKPSPPLANPMTA